MKRNRGMLRRGAVVLAGLALAIAAIAVSAASGTFDSMSSGSVMVPEVPAITFEDRWPAVPLAKKIKTIKISPPKSAWERIEDTFYVLETQEKPKLEWASYRIIT